MEKQIITNADCVAAARLVAQRIIKSVVEDNLYGTVLRLYGIPRGGISAAYLVSSFLRVPNIVVDSPDNAHWIIDDLIDSGVTIKRYKAKYPNAKYATLFAKKSTPTSSLLEVQAIGEKVDSNWLVFPWEQAEEHDTSAHDAVIRLIQYLGDDPTREGLLETPSRVLKAYGEWFKGYGQEPADFMKTFEDGAANVDEMVLLTDIPIYSHCEHHMTPFVGVAHVAYIPNGKIVGLSKIARVVEIFSRRLQVQERLTNQIADCIEKHLNPLGVAVVIKAKHFCMATRGVKMPNVDTTTSAMRGVFLEKPAARAEYMSLLPRTRD